MITDCLLIYNFIYKTKQIQSTAFMDTSQGATHPRLDSLPLVSQTPSSGQQVDPFPHTGQLVVGVGGSSGVGDGGTTGADVVGALE